MLCQICWHVFFLKNHFLIYMRKNNKLILFSLRRSLSCSWSPTAQGPALGTCRVWPVCLTSLVAGVHLCPAACCGTSQTLNIALKQKRVKVSAICCWHHNTVPCVRSTEIALHVLRYSPDVTKTKWICCKLSVVFF